MEKLQRDDATAMKIIQTVCPKRRSMVGVWPAKERSECERLVKEPGFLWPTLSTTRVSKGFMRT
jgi:hypothetical protein